MVAEPGEPPGICGRLVVMPTAADGVSHPPHQRQYQADDQEDEPEDQNDMCEGEGRDEAGEKEPQDDKEDPNNDHDVYQFLRGWLGGWFPGSVFDGVFGFTADGLAVRPPTRRVPFTARPSRVSGLEFQAERGEWANRNRNVRREQTLIKFSGVQPNSLRTG